MYRHLDRISKIFDIVSCIFCAKIAYLELDRPVSLVVVTRAANSIEFYSSSSLTYFSKSEFKFEFSNLIFTSSSSSSTKISFFELEFRQRNIQNRDNFFTARAHAIKKIKI